MALTPALDDSTRLDSGPRDARLGFADAESGSLTRARGDSWVSVVQISRLDRSSADREQRGGDMGFES